MIDKRYAVRLGVVTADDLEGMEETLAILSDSELMAAIRERADEPAESISKEELLARLAARPGTTGESGEQPNRST